MLNDLLTRLRALLRRDSVETELDDEVQFHFDQQVAKYIASGMTRDEATRRARLEFGGLDQVKEECRDARGIRFLETLAQDIRYGLRMLRKSPGFTMLAVLTLAFAIGATTALFSIVEAVLLKPLPYYDASRLAVLWTDNVRKELHQERTSYPNFEDWQNQNTTFQDLAFASAFTVSVTTGEEPERLLAGRASANLFSLMGVEPIVGRTFSIDEEQRAERVIVVSQALWQRSLGSSRDLAGKSLEVDGVKMAVVGVMPAMFQFPARRVDLWEPLTVFPNWSALRTKRDTPSGFVVGRLRPGVSFYQAQADMGVVAARLIRQYPNLAANIDFFGFGVNVVPFNTYIIGQDVRTALWLLFGAVSLVLFIACTNVASLLLSRSAARSTEIATRVALGAGRKRLTCQLLTETAVLYLISSLLAIAFAAAAENLLIRLAPTDIPRLHEAGIDLGVLSFALGLSFVTALIFGLFPAMKVSATDPQLALKQSGRHSSEAPVVVRLRSILVTGQLALAVILVVGAGLLIRSFLRVQDVDPGFRSDHVLTVRIVQSKLKSETQWTHSYEQSLYHIKAIPGVEAVGAIDNFFFASLPDETVIAQGHSALSSATSLSQVTDDGISPGYFQALGVPLLRGRFFTEEDGPTSMRTAIINATMSRRFWPNEDPMGKRFKFAYQAEEAPWITVVGVVGDMHRDGLVRDPVSEIFLPFAQNPARGMDLVVRTSADPRSFASAVRAAIRSADETAPVINVSTLEEALRDQIAPRRFQTVLLGSFSVLALLLSAIGLYGLISYSVIQRTQEIGIRVALGAQPAQVIQLILAQGGRTALLGIGAGIVGALCTERVLRTELFGVSPTDPATLLAVALLLCSVAFTACLIPALRAMRLDPTVALRHE